jgi:predicted phage terminase large subunit-like protein
MRDYVPYMWSTVESDPYIGGWHVDAVCDHLQALLEGQIRKLVINLPPRHTKSLLSSVMLPSYGWLRYPSLRWLFSSYAATLSIRDSVKCRRVLQSQRYQGLVNRYQPGMEILGDENTKVKYANNRGGVRLATSVNGANTGEGGDIIVVDDAHNVREVESDNYRKSTLFWWDEVMSTRLNNPKTGRYLIIMQRSHEEDLAGHVLSKDSGWNILCLPARYERNDHRTLSPLKFKDPRTVEGEPLCPERYGEVELKALEGELGPYASAGQLQQRPVPREGAMIPVDNLVLVHSFNERWIEKSVRYWDKAGTTGGGCFTAGVLMHKLKQGPFKYIVADVIAGQWSHGQREQTIKDTAEMDGKAVTVWTEKEPGSGGKESAERTVENLDGYSAFMDGVSGQGSKEKRAEPFSAQVYIGNVAVLIRPWTKAYVDEMRYFPRGKFKDKVDGTSGAYNKLAVKSDKKKVGVWGSD